MSLKPNSHKCRIKKCNSVLAQDIVFTSEKHRGTCAEQQGRKTVELTLIIYFSPLQMSEKLSALSTRFDTCHNSKNKQNNSFLFVTRPTKALSLLRTRHQN